MITVGCDRATVAQALAVAAPLDGVYATVGLHPHEARYGVDDDPRPPRRPACGPSRSASAGSTTTTTTRRATPSGKHSPHRSRLAIERDAAARDPHPRGVGRHVRHPRCRGCAGADDLPLLHRRARTRPVVPRPWRVRQLLRDRHVQRRTGRARGGGAGAARRARSSRPTARTSRRSRTAASATGRRGCRSWAHAWPRSTAFTVDEIRTATRTAAISAFAFGARVFLAFPSSRGPAPEPGHPDRERALRFDDRDRRRLIARQRAHGRRAPGGLAREPRRLDVAAPERGRRRGGRRRCRARGHPHIGRSDGHRRGRSSSMAPRRQPIGPPPSPR